MSKLIEMKAVIAGKMYENGQWVEIKNPSTDEVIGQVPALTQKEINDVYTQARSAFLSWKKIKPLERIALLNKWKELIQENADMLADLMVQEIAKGKKASLSEIARSAEYMDYTFEEAKRLHPTSYNGDAWGVNNKIAIFEHEPKGVVLCISPFNYPVNLAIAKIIPALVVGNTVVFKPATQGSLVGLALAHLAVTAGIPAGVFSAVTGKGSEIGDLLVTNPEINVISFTGSTGVGEGIARLSAKADLIFELGGKDPAIVLADADLLDTADKIVKGAFSYSGQRCTAIKRVLVHTSVKEQLTKLLIDNINKLKVGFPVDDADITPVIDAGTVKFIQGLIDDALAKKAICLTGNKTEKNLMWPTLLDNVTPEMRIASEEPFGPVLPILTFNTIEEAIEIANSSNFGLQAAIFTKDIDSAFSIARELETGTVNINGQTQRGPDHFPFLGIKDSGLGVQGIIDSLKSFTRPKGVVINFNSLGHKKH